MSKQFFGTDGIRGLAGEYPIDSEGMSQIGNAVGACFTEPGDLVIIGWDPRESSEGLAASCIEGLVAMGAEVHKMSVLPTPGLAYLTEKLTAKAGVMITASHNPYTDNGIKVFTPDGRKLSDEDQAKLNKLLEQGVSPRDSGSDADDREAVKLYEDFLVQSAGGSDFKGLRLALDSANGATSGIAGRVFERLGAEVTTFADKPDGRNINDGCGATDVTAVSRMVTDNNLGCGIAFDGDGDRVVMIDDKGRELSGDHIMYILAVSGHQKGVVATIMSNQGLETALSSHGITLSRTAVGDRSVLAGMDASGFRLGGEQSGHIIISDYGTTGDGMLAAIRTLAAVKDSGKSLAEWHDELTLLPQALLSIPFPDKSMLERADIQSFIAKRSAELGGNGRLNVRASGTEPKIRVMVEAPDAENLARDIADELLRLAGGKEES